MIKYNKKERTFIIVDRNRTMINEWVGFLDLKALSLKDQLESDEIDKFIAYMKPIMINATDRNTISLDKYQFYFNKFLKSKSITYQNDVLTKETVKTKGLKTISAVCGIIATCFMIYNYMNSDTTVKTAALVAARRSKIFNKTNSLLSHGYGDEDQGTCWADQ